jgi:hypothetical protein
MVKRVILVLSLSTVVVVAMGAGYAWLRSSQSSLRDLRSLDELRDEFNRDRGKPRLVLLLSPT